MRRSREIALGGLAAWILIHVVLWWAAGFRLTREGAARGFWPLPFRSVETIPGDWEVAPTLVPPDAAGAPLPWHRGPPRWVIYDEGWFSPATYDASEFLTCVAPVLALFAAAFFLDRPAPRALRAAAAALAVVGGARVIGLGWATGTLGEGPLFAALGLAFGLSGAAAVLRGSGPCRARLVLALAVSWIGVQLALFNLASPAGSVEQASFWPMAFAYRWSWRNEVGWFGLRSFDATEFAFYVVGACGVSALVLFGFRRPSFGRFIPRASAAAWILLHLALWASSLRFSPAVEKTECLWPFFPASLKPAFYDGTEFVVYVVAPLAFLATRRYARQALRERQKSDGPDPALPPWETSPTRGPAA